MLATFTIVAPVYVIVFAFQDIFATPFPRLPVIVFPFTSTIEALPAVIVELAKVPTYPEPPELVGHDVQPPQYPPPAPPFAQPSDPRDPPFHPPTEHVLLFWFGFAYPNEPAIPSERVVEPPSVCVAPVTVILFAVNVGAVVPPPSFPKNPKFPS